MRLKGKKALITGGNSGIGLATARLFVAEGAEVAITGRDQKTLDEAVAELGSKAHGYRADVTVAEDRKKLFAELAKDFGKLDIVFANAGISGRTPTGTYRRGCLRERHSHEPQRRILYRQFSRSSVKRQRQHHLQRIGAHLSRSTRCGCLRCYEGRTRLDGAVYRRRSCTAQDSRERGGPGSDRDSHLETRAARQCHSRGIRKTFQLLLLHGSTWPLGQTGRSGQGGAFPCLGRFVVYQCGRVDG